MNDESRLSKLYRLGTRPPRGRDACLTAQEILAALDGEPLAKERAADHAGQCSACAEELRLALSLDSLGKHPSPMTGTRWLRLAAAVVLGAGLALFAVRLPRADTEGNAVRGEAETVWASTTPPDGATLGAPPTRLTWDARPGASGYEVALFDEESTLLWESPRLAAPGADLPSEVRARLQRGGNFTWRVMVSSPAGRSTSPLLRFEVRP